MKRGSGLATACAVLTLLSFARAAWPIEMKPRSMDAQGPIQGVAVADVNGDHQLDLLVSVSAGAAPNERRLIRVFLGRDGDFPEKATWTVEVPAAAGVFDTADTDGDGKDELLFIERDAVRLVHFSDAPGAPTTVAKAGCSICFPDRQRLPYLDLVRNWRGDARVEAMLPGDGTLRFYEAGEGGFKPAETLRVEMKRSARVSTFGNRAGYGVSLTGEINAPEWFLVDFDGDKDADLYISGGERIEVFRQTDGRFETKPAFSRYFNIETAEEIRLGNTTLTARVEDLDADGYGDVVFDKFGGSLTDFHSDIRVFRGGPGGLPTEPSYTNAMKGYTGGLDIADADGDGKADLLVPLVDINIPAIVKFLVTKKVTMAYNWYPQGGAGLYPAQPARTTAVTFYADTTHGFEVSGSPPAYGHDFDGDGAPDLIVGSGRDRLTVMRGLGGGKFDEQNAFEFEAPATDLAMYPDFNGDGKADLLLWYQTTTRTGQIRAYFSR